MYYAFKKSMIWCLIVISILVSAPCILIILVRLIQTNNLTDETSSYISKLTVGSVYLGRKYQSLDALVSDNTEIMIDVVVYFNMAGILYLLLHSIFLRRSLVRMHCELDRKEVSPSDYAVLVRGIPREMTKKTLTE